MKGGTEIYFFRIAKGKYFAACPVFIVADDPGSLTFTVAVDDARSQRGDLGARMCRLRHEELLDAAHIIPDREEGPPVVRNGLALCKLHHAAFDRHFIGIRPDLIVEVRPDVLEEQDGPMLLHGLQGMNRQPILTPRARADWPDPVFLQRRYERFRAAEA